MTTKRVTFRAVTEFHESDMDDFERYSDEEFEAMAREALLYDIEDLRGTVETIEYDAPEGGAGGRA